MFPFTKGENKDSETPSADANFMVVSMI